MAILSQIQVQVQIGRFGYSILIFVVVENTLFAYADDPTLLAVVHNQADRPAVAASLDRDLGKDSRVVQSLVHDTES